MTRKGHVQNGGIILDEPLNLPDGTVVILSPVGLPEGKHHPDVERFAGVIPAESGEERKEYLDHLRKKHQ